MAVSLEKNIGHETRREDELTETNEKTIRREELRNHYLIPFQDDPLTYPKTFTFLPIEALISR